MKIKSYSHKGKKDVNQDCIGYNSHCLIVCDGVGGASKGDVASKLIVDTILKNVAAIPTDKKIVGLIESAHKELNQLVLENPLLEGMATTIASIFIIEQGVLTAHAGDSRIYFIKPDQNLFWQSWDHSIVGKLVQKNEITREEARSHPMNNQIFNAIRGNVDGNVVVPEINFISDLKSGDLCFICSDGVAESFSDRSLLEVLSNQVISIEQKLDIIKQDCAVKSNDNHSAIICEFEPQDVNQHSGFRSDWINISTI